MRAGEVRQWCGALAPPFEEVPSIPTIAFPTMTLRRLAAAALAVALLAALALPVTAAPPAVDDGAPGWHPLLDGLWHRVASTFGWRAEASGTDDGNLGPDMDPNGLSASDDNGNLGPEMDPAG